MILKVRGLNVINDDLIIAYERSHRISNKEKIWGAAAQNAPRKKAVAGGIIVRMWAGSNLHWRY